MVRDFILTVRQSTCPCLSVRKSTWLRPTHAYTFVRTRALLPCLSVRQATSLWTTLVRARALMYCAANTYFCLIRARISSFVRVPFSPVSLYVNLRVPVYLSVNLRGFGLRTRIRSFVRVLFFPVCLSVNLRRFGPRSSVRVPLSQILFVGKVKTMYTNMRF